MRLTLHALLLALAIPSPAVAFGEFPFDGYIAAEQAEVASGPGRRYYTTDRLPRGTKVEVYREDDAGWLAIRPPEGSFSWVPAVHVEILEDGVGKVKSAAECWIGTHVENVGEHKSQVSLKPGELVEIIGRKQVASEGGDEEWLKIAPPAGEYRYVHSRDISRELIEPDQPAEPDEQIAADPAQLEAAARAGDAGEGASEPRTFRPAPSSVALSDIDLVRSKLAAMREDLSGLAGGSRRPVRPDRAGKSDAPIQVAQFQASSSERLLSPDGFVPRKRRTSEQLGPQGVPDPQFTRTSSPAFARPHLESPRTGTRSTPQSTIAVTPIATAATPPANSAATIASQLAQLDLELSLMLAQDKSTWNLAAIRQHVLSLVEGAPTPGERGQARLLLDKVKQFEDAFAVADQGPLGSTAGAASAEASPYAPRYDAKGWLKPVVSRKEPAAPYAIVDDDGKPLCFVTPSPGLNLGRYANKEVGLYGKRGFIEALKTPHLTAERVIDLDRHIR